MVGRSFRPRLLAANLLLLCGGTLFGLFVAELLTRIVAPQRPTPAFVWSDDKGGAIYQLDSAFGFVLRPSIDHPFIFGTHVETNTLGLRDHDYEPKRPGEFRILSLGDSHMRSGTASRSSNRMPRSSSAD